jgi:hypothetical protein
MSVADGRLCHLGDERLRVSQEQRLQRTAAVKLALD